MVPAQRRVLKLYFGTVQRRGQQRRRVTFRKATCHHQFGFTDLRFELEFALRMPDDREHEVPKCNGSQSRNAG